MAEFMLLGQSVSQSNIDFLDDRSFSPPPPFVFFSEAFVLVGVDR